MAATERLTPKRDWSEPFFASYRQSGNVRLACEAAGVTRQAAYARRDTDEEFAGRWAEAAESAVERLEDIAWKRAEAGSDVLVMFLLKGLRPDKYRDNPKVLVQAGRMSDGELISAAKGILAGVGPEGAETPGNGRQ
jgi:hypothetical protein